MRYNITDYDTFFMAMIITTYKNTNLEILVKSHQKISRTELDITVFDFLF